MPNPVGPVARSLMLAKPKQAVSSSWKPVHIGGGGWLVGIDIAPDGSRVARADVYGAYLWKNGAYQQLVTAKSVPALEADINVTSFNPGVFEIIFAPSNSNRLYMIWNNFVHRSDDKGTTWKKTNSQKFTDAAANGTYRMYGRKMAVDPANQDVVYASTPATGVIVSTDAGVTWTAVTALGTGTNAGYCIVFDPSSSVVGGKTQGIYIAKSGTGVYRSTDGGATFTLLSSSPTTFGHMAIGSDGKVYVTDAVQGTSQTLYKFISGAWSTVTVGTGVATRYAFGVAVDPANPAHIVVSNDAGGLSASFDYGATWTAFRPWTQKSSDIPWLAPTNPFYMSCGRIAFDPTASNKLYHAAGVGVWYGTPPASSSSTVDWFMETKGIEELVANRIVTPPYGAPMFVSWDFGIFRLPDVDAFPATYGPVAGTVCAAWDVDWAPATPSFLACISNITSSEQSAYSTDGGKTWTQFASKPAHVTDANKRIGGGMAVLDTNNILWFPSNNCPPYRTADRGATWTEMTFSGVSNDPATVTGWGASHSAKRHIVCADRVTAGVAYAYNYQLPGLFKTTDYGVTWTLVFSGAITTNSSNNGWLEAVPGYAGHLFFANGPQSGTVGNVLGQAFRRSTDGGATWTDVPNVKEVYAFGFGKGSGTYPAIAIYGAVNGVFGVYLSDDNCATWTSYGGFPNDSLDFVSSVSGDNNLIGRVYVGFNGSGFLYRDAIVKTAAAASVGVSYDTDAQALFARMTAQPASGYAQAISDLIAGLKSDNLWTRLDGLYVPAAMGASDYLKCAKNSAYDLVSRAAGATYTLKIGIVFNTAGYFGTNFNPATAGGKTDLTDTSMFVYIENDAGVTSTRYCGNTNATIGRNAGATSIKTHANDATDTFSGSGPVGHLVTMSRDRPLSYTVYRDGVLQATNTVTATAMTSAEYELGRGGTTPCSGALSVFGFGGAMSAGNNAALNTRVAAFRAAIAAL